MIVDQEWTSRIAAADVGQHSQATKTGLGVFEDAIPVDDHRRIDGELDLVDDVGLVFGSHTDRNALDDGHLGYEVEGCKVAIFNSE